MMEIKKVPEKKPEENPLKGVTLGLPSRGVDYPVGGEFLIRPPLVEEVEFIAEMTPETFEENLTRLLHQLILKPRELDPWDLTTGDRSYLHLWVRAQIHPSYFLDVVCPKCHERDEGHPLLLDTIPVKTVPEEYTGPREFELPLSKKKVVLRLDTGRDEQTVQEEVAVGRNKWRATYTSPIVSIDGEKRPFKERYAWVGKLPPGDYLFIREFYNWAFHGPDYAECPFTCRKCKEASVIRLPFRREFYIPTIPFKRAFGDAIHSSSVREGSVPVTQPQEDGVRGVPVASKQGG